VCALKPIRLYRQGNQEAAFTSISKSALRRVPRLVLPTALITCIIWLLAQLGAFIVANRTDSWWIGWTSPTMIPYLGASVKNLMYNIITTWTKATNKYDGNQWTLFPLLKGSMEVYVFLMAMAYVQPRYRMMASLGMWVYFYIGGDCKFFSPEKKVQPDVRSSFFDADKKSRQKQPPSGCSSSGASSWPICRTTRRRTDS